MITHVSGSPIFNGFGYSHQSLGENELSNSRTHVRNGVGE